MSSELQGDEKIDIFSMQHGPISTPFINSSIPGTLTHLPPDRIRNVYNSACSVWGRITKVWSSGIDFAPAPKTRDTYPQLNASVCAIHANDNSSGFLSLGLLMNEISKTGNWAIGVEKAFRDYDRLITELIVDVGDAIKDGSLQNHLRDECFTRLRAFLPKALRSRVIIHGKQGLPRLSSWDTEEQDPGYSSRLLVRILRPKLSGGPGVKTIHKPSAVILQVPGDPEGFDEFLRSSLHI